MFLLSVFSAIAIYTNRNRHKEILPYAVAVLMAIADFFLFLIIFHKNPFDTYMTSIPTRGEGLNPLLQNAYMITHPPSLYTGFVGMSIPFAFAMGALISGHLDDAWIAAVRRWTLISWFFLAMGLTLGMLWAYEELGWGGFWAWDPVENAGFLPWLTATAFFHSTMIQERRGMMKVWNFSLVILTFFLTIFGTYLTRSGIVQSVHAFGEDKKLGGMFTGLHGHHPGGQLRLPDQAAARAAGPGPAGIGAVARGGLPGQQLDPAGGDVLRHVRHDVPHPVRGGHRRAHQRRPAVLQQVDGADRAGAAVPDRRRAADRLAQGLGRAPEIPVHPADRWRRRRRWRSAWASGCTARPSPRSSAFAFCAFTAVDGDAGVRARGARSAGKNTGSDIITSLLGMILRGRRRYGGYIVHLGIVLMFLGFAGQAYQKEEEMHLKPGQVMPFGRYDVRFDRLRHEEDRQKEMLTGDFTMFKRGQAANKDAQSLAQMHPARWYYHGRNGEFTTEVAINRGLAEDLYITLGGVDFADGSGTFKVVVNPLVDWVWLGFMLLAIGVGIALMPELALAPIAAKIGAATGAGTGARSEPRGTGAAALLLAAGFGLAVSLYGGGQAHAAVDQEVVKREMSWFGTNLRCMCTMGGNGCGHMLKDCGAECGGAPKFRQEIRAMLEQGKTREQIVAFFAERHGGMHVLGAPPDQGFNRLAWALPYGLGLAGAGALAFTAWRFSKRPRGEGDGRAQAAADKVISKDRDLEDKLEDELSRVDS